MEAQLGNLEWAHLLVTLGDGWKGALEVEHLSLYGSSVKEAWRDSSLAGHPGGQVEKVLEKGISFHMGPTEELWRGLIYRGL